MQKNIFCGAGKGVSQVCGEMFRNGLWALNSAVKMVRIRNGGCQPYTTSFNLE
jgi:hypothetical protein